MVRELIETLVSGVCPISYGGWNKKRFSQKQYKNWKQVGILKILVEESKNPFFHTKP